MCVCTSVCERMGTPCVLESTRPAGCLARRLKLIVLSVFPPHCGACRAERSQSVCPPYKLQLEECLTAEQVPTPELIQGYVKKVGARVTNAKLKVLSVCAQLEGGKQGGRDGEGWMQRQCGGFLYIYTHRVRDPTQSSMWGNVPE